MQVWERYVAFLLTTTGVDDNGHGRRHGPELWKVTAKSAIITGMNSKQRQTLSASFANPINGNIEWRHIESLLIALECQVVEGSGSRVTFILNDQRVDLHRPHPGKEALRYRVKDVRKFLQRAGVTL